MNKLLLGSAFAALALATPLAAQAQQLPPAVVAVVDRDRIARACAQCVAASALLNAQTQQFATRQAQLAGPLQTEQRAIETAIGALPQGGQPDAALAARIQTFRTNSEAAERELRQADQVLRRNQQYVVDQILERMNPLIQQVTRERGANVAFDIAATVASSPALNVTDAVLTLMNANSTPFGAVAPPPAAPAAAAPAPAAATPTPPRPRPQGR